MSAPHDEHARDELVERLLRHRAWLRAVARELVGESGADDVVQETWTAALAHPPSGPLRPWLGAVARRAALFVRRGDARRRSREERAARPEAVRSSTDLIERIDAEERLVRELRDLAEPFRTTLLLRYHEGLSAAEIARQGGVPQGTVRWRTKRGLDELRVRLERAFGGREAFGAALWPLVREGGPAAAAAATGIGGVLMLASGKWILAAGTVVALVAAGIGAKRWGARGSENRIASEAPVVLLPADPSAEVVTEATGQAVDVAEREPAAAQAAPRTSARLRILESDRSAHADQIVLLLADGERELESTRTDGAGWLELPPQAGMRRIRIERRGAFPHHASVDFSAGEQELVLPEEVVLAGRIVVDGERPRRPVALEVVAASSLDEAPDPGDLEIDCVETRTDADGQFTLRGARSEQGYAIQLPEGYVLPAERARVNSTRSARFHVPRPRRGLVLEVERLPSILGRLVEADGRTPTTGLVDCRFTWANGTNMDTGARADEDGWFVFFPEEPWRVIDLEYWGTPGVRGRTRASFERERIGADWVLGDLRLAPGRNLTLRVVEPDGNPIAGARTDLAGAPTNARGETSLRDVTAETARVGARGHREARVNLAPDAGVVTATLEPAPELCLEVLDASGLPLGGLLVELQAIRWAFDGDAPSHLLSAHREGRMLGWNKDPFVARFATGPYGRLRVDSLLAGIPFELRVLAQGGAIVHASAQPSLGPAERRVLGIQVEVDRLELACRVVDAQRTPVRGATVGLPAIRSGSHAHSFFGLDGWDGVKNRTDAEGRFACSVLDLPDLRVTVEHPDHLPLVRDFARVPREELELVLERGLWLGVTVVDEQGRPQAGGFLHVRGPDGQPAGEVASATPGRFDVRVLRAGRHEFVLRIGGGKFEHAHETHEPELTIRVPVMGAVAASWTLAAAEAREDFLTLEVRAPDGSVRLQEGFYDTPVGQHRFEPVLPGDYELVLKVDVESGELVLARATLQVVAGETAGVVLAE